MINLNIAGITSTSTVDWPGKLVTTIFLQGCPWDCFYCFNRDIIPTRTQGKYTWEDVEITLHRCIKVLDGVVFSGGEATRQSALIEALSKVKNTFGLSTGLHTGGAFPRTLEKALPLVDWVGYDVKALPKDYGTVVGTDAAGSKAWEGLDILLQSGVGYEIRTTVSPGSPQETNWEELVDLLRSKNVKNFALQKALQVESKPFRVDDPSWSSRLSHMRSYAERAGFDNFYYRG